MFFGRPLVIGDMVQIATERLIYHLAENFTREKTKANISHMIAMLSYSFPFISDIWYSNLECFFFSHPMLPWMENSEFVYEGKRETHDRIIWSELATHMEVCLCKLLQNKNLPTHTLTRSQISKHMLGILNWKKRD